MLKPLIRSAVIDGTLTADSTQTIDYVGGSPARIGASGAYGAVSDTGYIGLMVNRRASDIANGKCAVVVGPAKVNIWAGQGGDTDPETDNFCPFDTEVTWAIGNDLYIRNLTTYAVWSNYNYNSGVSHGFVTVAPASSTDKMEAWFLERR